MKRILALALAALLLLPALPVFAENTNGDGRLTNTDGFVYVLDESGYEASGLKSANHHLGKLHLGLEILKRI